MVDSSSGDRVGGEEEPIAKGQQTTEYGPGCPRLRSTARRTQVLDRVSFADTTGRKLLAVEINCSVRAIALDNIVWYNVIGTLNCGGTHDGLRFSESE
jgi:hypothetical protein